MSEDFLPDEILKHAGLVMAHEKRQTIEFEAGTQEESVGQGWESLEKYKQYFDLWALAREGPAKSERGKDDDLVVAAWTHGMLKPVVFTQCFVPVGKGGFALVGPVAISGKEHGVDLERIKRMFNIGIAQHPKNALWESWHRE